jgi:hypothetical protein
MVDGPILMQQYSDHAAQTSQDPLRNARHEIITNDHRPSCHPSIASIDAGLVQPRAWPCLGFGQRPMCWRAKAALWRVHRVRARAWPIACGLAGSAAAMCRNLFLNYLSAAALIAAGCINSLMAWGSSRGRSPY